MRRASGPVLMSRAGGDTLKCPLDAGKAPYFDRKVRVRIYGYLSEKVTY